MSLSTTLATRTAMKLLLPSLVNDQVLPGAPLTLDSKNWVAAALPSLIKNGTEVTLAVTI